MLAKPLPFLSDYLLLYEIVVYLLNMYVLVSMYFCGFVFEFECYAKCMFSMQQCWPGLVVLRFSSKYYEGNMYSSVPYPVDDHTGLAQGVLCVVGAT